MEKTTTKFKLGFSKLLLVVLFFGALISNLNAQVTVTITLNCNGKTGSLASGSVSSTGTINDGDMTTINSSANRGWAKFDLSFLPAGATITAANALFTTFSSTLSGAANSVFGFTGDASAMTGTTLYTNCANGTAFNSSTWSANALQVKALNATGISFLQANVGNANVNLGYVRGSTNTYNISGYPGRSAGTQPQLQITYTIPAAVPSSATTLSASKILVSSATLQGGITVGSTLPSSVTYTGIVVSTSANPTVGGIGVIDSTTTPLINSGTISFDVTGLTLGTTYHYRAYVLDTIGSSANIAYGADSTFTTPATAPVPTVQRNVATNVLANTATVGGTILSNGGIPILSSGVVYSSTNNNPVQFGVGVIDSTTNPVVTSGSFSVNPAGLTATTKYYYRAYATNSTGIAYSALDSFTTAPVISTFPYTQNFDGAGNTGWNSVIVVGSVNNWAVGAPTKATISAAFSTPNCWTTGLSTQYVDNHDAALVSPQLDLTSFTSNAVLKFKHRFITESCCDGGFLEISIGGGAWTKVENVIGTGANFNTTNGTAWYNLTTQGNSWADNSNAYSTQAGGWITSLIQLPGTSGQSNVRLRFRFVSDVSAVADGWAIDDIEVFAPAAPTVVTGTKSGITTNIATIGGNITNNGGSGITESGVVFSTSPAPTRGGFGVVDSTTNPLVTGGTFTKNVTGLLNATTYYYRAYAVNAVGTSYGADSTFTTNAAATAPTVLKIAATNVSDTGVNIGGNITLDGGAVVTSSGVVYSTTSNPLIGGLGVIDSTTNPLVTTGSFTFNIIGLTANTKYYYSAYAVNSAGTTYTLQDSFTTAPVVSTFPYTQNFDGSATVGTGWGSVATGGLNEWVLGTPAKTQLSGAYSGTKCWFTSTAANYSDNSNAAVVSPKFDCTSLTADPVVRFRHNFTTEAGWDGSVLEISINNGAWTKLDNTLGTGANFNTTNSISWYNNASASGPMTPPKWSENSNLFSSNTSNWIQSTTQLTGAAGQSNVRFRIRFASDASGTSEGWAFDNVEVFTPVAPTMLTGTKTNITTNQATLAGTIVSNGNAVITASGIVFSTTPAPTRGGFGVVDSATSPLAAGGSFTINVTGLTNATTYYYRAYAVNAVGTTYGADSTFTTNAAAVLPSILKIAATNISDSGVSFGGNITLDGGAPVTASGVVYATTSNPALLGSGVIDSTTSPLVTFGIFTVNPIGLSPNTKYYYRAYATNSVGTAYSTQDSFTTPPIISTLPYNQNFDAVGVNTGWTTVATGGLNEWLVGTPAKTQLNGAYSGTKCWYTSAATNYSDNHNGAVVSPRFDFTNFTSDPVVRFMHNFVTESGWDAAVLEISINNGAWTQLDNNLGTGTNFNTLTSYSWYNNSSTSGPMTPPKWSENSNLFSSNASNWIQTATRLTGAAGQSNVKFRIRFASDGSGTDEGWAVDDIQVVSDITPTIPTGTVTLTPNGTSVNVAFVPGNGQGRMVVARLTTATAVAPYDTVLYTANAAFGSGTLVGPGNYVVYNGTGTSVNVTGLTTVTGYSFDVYEYNGKYMHNKFAAASSSTTTTLPVKLLSFTANNVDGNVQLKWLTANEINNKGFEVERSTDGKNFRSIDFVKGAGNTNKTTSYSKIDLGAFIATSSNVLYYRLKQVDFDGTPTYSNQIVVNENELASNGVKVYPNPFTKTLTVDISSDVNTNTTIAITDISGKEISTTLVPVSVGNNTTTLPNLDLLTAGVYFVKVSNGTKAEVFKVVKY